MSKRWYTNIYMAFFYKSWTSRTCLLYLSGILLLLIIPGIILYINYWKLELWPWYPSLDHWCDRESIPEYVLHPTSDEITVVTMFLNLGIFKKGEEMLAYHSPYKYRRWMRVFGRLSNPVVAYMENENDVEYFRKIRSCLPPHLTKIIRIQREELPSFKHISQIRDIYSDPSYPKIYPNTIYPEYTCSMNAKYDVLEKSSLTDFFKTPYIAWLDIGLFRKLDGTHYGLFKLAPPAKFKADRVAFSEAWHHFSQVPVKKVMLNKLVWVSGSMILATKEVMLNFTQRYKEAVVELLKKGLSNTDQEVVYAMYTDEMWKPNQIEIEPFTCQQGQLGLWGSDARYFYLAYVCKDAWMKRIYH